MLETRHKTKRTTVFCRCCGDRDGLWNVQWSEPGKVQPRIRRCHSSQLVTGSITSSLQGDACWANRHLILWYRLLKKVCHISCDKKKDDVKKNSPDKSQLLPTSFISQRLSLLLDTSCNEMQPVLQLVDLDNSSHTHPTHQRATNRPARKQRYLVSEQYCMLAQIYVFLDSLLHKKGLKSVLFHLVLAFRPRLNEG